MKRAWMQLQCSVFFQAEDGIRDVAVTGVQTCALPICDRPHPAAPGEPEPGGSAEESRRVDRAPLRVRRARGLAAGRQRAGPARLPGRLAPRLRRGRQRPGQGSTDHLPGRHRRGGPSQRRGHPRVPRGLRRRGGVRAVAAAVPRARGERLAARGQGNPQYLWRHHQRPRGHARGATAARRAHHLASERRHPMTASWRSLPASIRTLGRWVTIVQLVGYSTSLVFVWHTTRLVPPGIESRYRGADPETSAGAMQFPKSFGEMLTITHTHLLSMAVIFVITGSGGALCERVGERRKRWLIAEPFAALLVSFSAMWLMRYVDPRFSWLLEASSALLAVTFYLQSYLILRELRDKAA